MTIGDHKKRLLHDLLRKETQKGKLLIFSKSPEKNLDQFLFVKATYNRIILVT